MKPIYLFICWNCLKSVILITWIVITDVFTSAHVNLEIKIKNKSTKQSYTDS